MKHNRNGACIQNFSAYIWCRIFSSRVLTELSSKPPSPSLLTWSSHTSLPDTVNTFKKQCKLIYLCTNLFKCSFVNAQFKATVYRSTSNADMAIRIASELTYVISQIVSEMDWHTKRLWIITMLSLDTGTFLLVDEQN